ncbi:MAG: DUF3788 domain-containing protein [Gemmatimonadota bacterium]|nr:MAG: DUF3788 domain-containing protein [Gemmatimonadota bacterium]
MEVSEMALSAFGDKSRTPRPTELKKTLGRTSDLWDKLKDHLESQYQPLSEKWSFAGQKWGWSLQLKQKKRTILYMTPREGFFSTGFVLGERAVKAAHASDLSDSVLAMIDSAKKYVEGRGVRIEVRTKKDLDTTKKLAAIKMAK